ncbi:hypothetical protein ACFRCQ_22065 [Cytobacillus firmus]|uniref:hypothetical protein n=1 Tax=Cytobacillus firmus TaxID=1399 RepID=UPI00368A77B2
MSKFEIIPLPSRSRSDFPSKELLERSLQDIPENSPFKEIAQYSFNEIQKFEQNKTKEDLLIRILSPLPSGKISLSALNTVSSGIQRVFTSVYNTFLGKGNTRGMIPKDIVDSSELILTATSPGSFKLHIDLKNQNPIIASHDSDALKQFSDLFDALYKQDDYTVIAEEYGIRTFNILKNWFQDLNRGNVEFEYLNNQENKRVFLSKDLINNATKQLESIKTRELLEPLELLGELVSASSTNNSFAISANDTLIKGKTSADVFKLGLTINKLYKFNLTKKIIENTASGHQKESFFLNSIEPFKD